MSLTLYSHPFSSYCQKTLIAHWERDVRFTFRRLEDPGPGGELAAALEVRFMDRFFDHYVMTALQRPVLTALRRRRR